MRVLIGALALWLAAMPQASDVFAPRPLYPATLHNVEATITASYVVGADGVVRDVKILTANPNQAFADATRAALQQWRVRPPAKAAVDKPETRTFFFSPPDGIQLQFAIDDLTRKRVTANGSVVTVTSGRGWLLSLLKFEDFELTGEVRVPSGTDASLLVRTWPNPNAAPGTTYDVALGTDPKQQPGAVTGGKLKFVTKTFDGAASQAYAEAVPSTWPSLKVECLGRSLRVSLGGRQVTEADLLEGFIGHVGLQVRKGSIDIRNFRIRRLDASRASVPLTVLYPDAPIVPDDPSLTNPVFQGTPALDYAGANGKAKVDAVFEADGSIGTIQIVESGGADVDAAAIATIKRWHFTPALRDGQPLRVIGHVYISFGPQ